MMRVFERPSEEITLVREVDGDIPRILAVEIIKGMIMALIGVLHLMPTIYVSSSEMTCPGRRRRLYWEAMISPYAPALRIASKSPRWTAAMR